MVPVLLLVVGVISFLYLSAEPPKPERPPEEPRKIRTTVEDVALGFGVVFASAITLYLIPCLLLLGQNLSNPLGRLEV